MRAATKRLITLIAIVIVLIFLHLVGWWRPLEVVVGRVANPIAHFFYRTEVTIREQIATWRSHSDLARELAALEDDNRRLRLLLIQAENLKTENAELRALFKFERRLERKIIPAEIVGRASQGIENVLLISAGEDHGVKIGAPVIAYDGVLVGTVTRVRSKTAFIRLLQDKDSKVAATILPRSHPLGIVQGGFGATIRLELVPQNEEIKEGDLVTTAGLEAGMPQGLLIGEVEAIIKEPFAPFVRAQIKPAAISGALRTVGVLSLDAL